MTGTPAPATVYHPAIDLILTRLLGREGPANLRQEAETPGCDPLTALLHDAAVRAGERQLQLARRIKHTIGDLQAAAQELADARPAEHLLTGRHDELLALAARHHDALDRLETTTRAYSVTRNARHQIAIT
ncbi:hypothetical protein [Actinospica robiniae]|uniref:hypothetical protein n=1 Tax=Actinospica robiniae TaxID=304901 RepID=UPI000428FA7F|nr:hypothetical protein [Actinospica robiniae]